MVTSTGTLEKLKKQAKKLQRNHGGKHPDLLDLVDRGACYLHPHHVITCLEASGSRTGLEALLDEMR